MLKSHFAKNGITMHPSTHTEGKWRVPLKFMTHWIPARENMRPRPFWRSHYTVEKIIVRNQLYFLLLVKKKKLSKTTITCTIFELLSHIAWLLLCNANMNYTRFSHWISWTWVDRRSGTKTMLDAGAQEWKVLRTWVSWSFQDHWHVHCTTKTTKT